MLDEQADRPRAFLIGVKIPRRRPALGEFGIEESLEELGDLADTAGFHAVGQTYQSLFRPDPATLIRKGKIEEVKHWIEELDADIVIFDDELSPRHQRELEREFGDDIRVIDRTALILDIFAAHALSREGALQVLLAQYEYRFPRLTRQWSHLARQAGGGGGRGGAAGVGLRGPGETQLETDRREISRIVSRLRRELDEVRTHRAEIRLRRQESNIPVVSLVGYTNAGKSTLLNRLSGANVLVADRLFATLDPTTRRVDLPSGRQILVTDTVGFIQKLPHHLVKAFQATLEEVADADLIVHVVDSSNGLAVQRVHTVQRILRDDLGIVDLPCILALNKVDLQESSSTDVSRPLEGLDTPMYRISAKRGTGVDALVSGIDQCLLDLMHTVTVEIPYSAPKLIAQVEQVGTIEKRVPGPNSILLQGKIPQRYLAELEGYLVADTSSMPPGPTR